MSSPLLSTSHHWLIFNGNSFSCIEAPGGERRMVGIYIEVSTTTPSCDFLDANWAERCQLSQKDMRSVLKAMPAHDVWNYVLHRHPVLCTKSKLNSLVGSWTGTVFGVCLRVDPKLINILEADWSSLTSKTSGIVKDQGKHVPPLGRGPCLGVEDFENLLAACPAKRPTYASVTAYAKGVEWNGSTFVPVEHHIRSGTIELARVVPWKWAIEFHRRLPRPSRLLLPRPVVVGEEKMGVTSYSVLVTRPTGSEPSGEREEAPQSGTKRGSRSSGKSPRKRRRYAVPEELSEE
jgi:hypothetical protein